MLVLTRKIGEQIVIDNNIRITVVSFGNGRVKIGIDAPPTVKVDRQEIHDKKVAEQAGLTGPPAPEAQLVDTPAPAIHNRIATKLPPAPAPAVQGPPAPEVKSAEQPVAVENRLKQLDRRFPPRKPR
ncbi:carbon storage regulator [Fimbriiglobus ruber]|uniref:Translational regulator CsrA n=1 Tax=Fimbriiglobus ruber TaxID=1908690 RepID=A0A225DK74_9BACT|nr:carbon storage regulator [Fimbriiglobus ruber]OWK41772.1 Carbon storage regulator [Fimbriiglobus ruber]